MASDRTGDSRPTLDDVARMAGVSRATVSRVINSQRRVAADLTEIVEAAIQETGYVPNRTARSLVTGRTGSVVVAVSGSHPETDGLPQHSDVFADPFFSRVVWGCVRALRLEDVHPTLMLVEAEADRAQVIAQLRQGSADGALLISTLADDPLPEMLVELGFRAVSFARPARSAPMSFVDVGNIEGARLAAEHLFARGCRRPAVISGPIDVQAAHDRVTGFTDAMRSYGLRDVPSTAGNFTLDSGEVALETLLDIDPHIDGIFASNDLMAVGALHALARRGCRVPDDVAVIGFDDSSVAALSRPTLTTVRQPMEEMAGRMARLLLDQLADREQPASSIVFDPSLVLRESA